jgi:hypothetical protein
VMISKARAQQLRWISSVLLLVYWIYFGLVQAHSVPHPSHWVKVSVFVGLGFIFLLQGYGLWVVGRWNKAENIPRGLKPRVVGEKRETQG